jgi:hypothetical protein
MLRSKLASPWIEASLEERWHEMEAGAWRWTRRALVQFSAPRPDTGA